MVMVQFETWELVKSQELHLSSVKAWVLQPLLYPLPLRVLLVPLPLLSWLLLLLRSLPPFIAWMLPAMISITSNGFHYELGITLLGETKLFDCHV